MPSAADDAFGAAWTAPRPMAVITSNGSSTRAISATESAKKSPKRRRSQPHYHGLAVRRTLFLHPKLGQRCPRGRFLRRKNVGRPWILAASGGRRGHRRSI